MIEKIIDKAFVPAILCAIVIMIILLQYKKTAVDACQENGMRYQSNSDIIGKGYCYYPDENGNIKYTRVPPYSKWKW